MASLQDIINLISADDSKAFIMDESGEIKLVIMGTGEYQRMLLGKLKQQVQDVEAINRRILEAQLVEEKNRPQAMSSDDAVSQKPKRVDMRSEVIDPNFDFDAEVIKPDFDDI